MSDELDRLLARGRLSGAQRDRILERVLDRTSSPRRLRLKHVLGIATPLVAAGVALILAPKLRDESDFSVKGGGASSSVEVTCSGGVLSACPIGSTLVFRFDGVSSPGYVQAYATPSPPTAGERVWYFPTSTVRAPRLEASTSSELLEKGVRIGSEHSATAYQITVVLSAQPLTREALLQAGDSRTMLREVIQLGIVRP